ncbi:MAG: hypothetical protein J6A44_06285 [Paludibacteraceae bacterium]|nr:hypothetical protein [Paludibacteraceae bacterium]
MKKLFYTLILCFFALNLSADIYFISNDSFASTLTITDILEGSNIPVTICSNTTGTEYSYIYKISNLPEPETEELLLNLQFTSNNFYNTDNTELQNNTIYRIYKNNGEIVLMPDAGGTFSVKIDLTIPTGGSNEAFLGINPNFYKSVSINGHVATYTFYSTLNPNGATILFPMLIYILDGTPTRITESSGVTIANITQETTINWSPSFKLEDDGNHRYYTKNSSVTAIHNLEIDRNATDSKEISTIYLDPANIKFGTITYNTTYTKAQVANWIFISSPFDATISVRISGYGNIPLTYTNDPNKGYTKPCYLLRSFDSQKRANGETYWKEEKSTSLVAGKGYILGIDPRSTNGTITVTYTSQNNTNIRKQQNEIFFEEYTGSFDRGQNQHLMGSGLMFNSSYIQNTSHTTQAPFSIALPNDNNWSYEIIYGENQNITLEPFSAYIFQGYGALNIYDRGFAPIAAAPARTQNSENSKTEVNPLELYNILLNGEHYNTKTTIFMSEEGADFLYFTKDIDGNSYANQFYSVDQDYACAHNHTKKENQAVSLGGCLAKAGEYTIALDGTNTTAKSVLLTDTYDGTTTELTTDSYTFSVNDSVVLNDRFIVTFSFAPDMPTDTYITEANQIIVYGNANNCNISNLTINEIVMIYDATGRLVYNQIAQTDNLNITLTPGTYIVRQADKWAKFNIANR